jgi:outer membrane protein OmpA-like peptidoglycan-associated protein
MKRAARCIAMMAVAFVLVPGLYAGQSTRTNASSGTDDQSTSTAPQKITAAVPPLGESSSQPAAAPNRHGGSDRHTPKVEWSFDYSFLRAMPTSRNNRIGYLHGGSTSIAYNFNRYLGLVADLGGFDNNHLTLFGPTSSQTLNANGSAFTYLFGPRLSYRRHERITPYAQALFGGVYASAVMVSGCTGNPVCTPLGSQNAFAAAFGVGLDIKLTHHVAWRLFEGDFMLTRFRDPFSAGGLAPGWQKDVRFSSGLVFRFGGNAPPPPPPTPMSASCSADKDTVYAGSGDFISVHARADNAGSNPVNYSWSASEGTVDGSGPDVRWNSSDKGPGTYRITARVDDGHGGSASCSADVRVVTPPPPPAPKPPVMSCSVDRGTVMAGERVSVTATASSPQNFTLTYAWRANAGQVVGTGTTVQFDTTGLGPGSYVITGRADDGHGQAADCTVNVAVQQPPPPPQASKINECAFKPAISARVDNVCKRVLDDVALRLQNEPKGTVVVVGFADPKDRRATKLSTDRANNASTYLVGKGIDKSRIVVRAGSGQEGAGPANHRIDIIWVPDGASY